MVDNEPQRPTSVRADRGGRYALSVAVRSLLRAVPLLWARRPRTPLRVLCVSAIEMLHRLDLDQDLPPSRLQRLVTLLDYGALLNAWLDRKPLRPVELEAAQQEVNALGMQGIGAEYLRCLRELERRRPLPGGDDTQFHKIHQYREGVARLSLRVLAAGAFAPGNQLSAAESPGDDLRFEALFRIVMQCQIIDDLLDYSHDQAADLPSFLTAAASLRQALHLTRSVANHYSQDQQLRTRPELLPLRIALAFVSAVAKILVGLSFCRLVIQPDRSVRRSPMVEC